MDNPWARKLGQVGALHPDDADLLNRLVASPTHYRADEDIIRVGDTPTHVNIILSGWACRYKILRNGQRQIVALLLPGDICDLTVFLLRAMDHSIGSMTATTVAKVSREDMLSILANRPNLTRSLWWSSLQDEAILREWIVGLGRRGSYQRTAHLLYELYLRLQGVGFVEESTFTLPMTQTQLSDILGMTNVHLNRVLQRMRSEGLITLQGKSLHFLDGERIRSAAAFDVDYLHLPKGSSSVE